MCMCMKKVTDYAINKLGAASFYPIITLSIGLATPKACCSSHHDVAEQATATQQQAKTIRGSAIFVYKRQVPDAAAVLPDRLRS